PDRPGERHLTPPAPHRYHASTFTRRVVVSSGDSISAVISSELGALSGPLHEIVRASGRERVFGVV
ncbi:citrate/2-methylcitrate synthase, partial [Streptomyces sp. BE308]|uniref:citrate/2-methylcitrate synthase n=1 Tax=Streptomyces sp. BE308 TaxID=3002529 RepID=UPI002E7A7252